MKAKGIKVSIDGVAGDEILSGYPSFLSLAKANINKDNYLKFFEYFKFFTSHSQNKLSDNLLIFMSQIKNRIFKKKQNENNQLFSNSFNNYLQEINLIKLRAQYTTMIKGNFLNYLNFKFHII